MDIRQLKIGDVVYCHLTPMKEGRKGSFKATIQQFFFKTGSVQVLRRPDRKQFRIDMDAIVCFAYTPERKRPTTLSQLAEKWNNR